MSKIQATRQKNEKIKRRYLEYKAEAEGFSKQSILVLEKALWKYDDCTWFEDYSKFNNQTAQRFKKYLATKINEKSKVTLGLRSQYHHLRHIKDFFTWLSGQPGYKSRIKLNDVMYLQLSNKDRQQATSSGLPSYPTLEQIKALCSFDVKNDIDKRDRALIAFTALTGIRDQALVTLRVGCFDQQTGMLQQLPSLGVQTKFNKEIFTTLLKIDDDLYNYFINWFEYLVKDKKFGVKDPLFPATLIGHIAPNNRTYESKGISKQFWSNANPVRQIFKKRSEQTGIDYFHPHAFRHFLIMEAEKHITTAEQMKALSQNLGHEHIATTYSSYGNMTPRRVGEVVKSINFSEQKPLPGNITPELLAEVIRRLQSNS